MDDKQILDVFTRQDGLGLSHHNGLHCNRTNNAFRKCEGCVTIQQGKLHHHTTCGKACGFLLELIEFQEEIDKLLHYEKIIDAARGPAEDEAKRLVPRHVEAAGDERR